jgi:hypothetical protein
MPVKSDEFVQGFPVNNDTTGSGVDIGITADPLKGIVARKT